MPSRMKNGLLMLALLMAVAGGWLSPAATTSAQDPTPTPTPAPQPGIVPDLTGLNTPQAAALLNRNSLRLGYVFTILWQPTSTTPPNLIGLGGQSVAPGQQVEIGTAVDIAIAVAPNVALVYDDNDITLMNLAGVPIDLSAVTFASVDGASPTSFAASRFPPSLRETQCFQLWSVGRNGPKAVEGCRFIQGWLSTINPVEHFWTGSNGATQFQVAENGVQIAVCQIAAQRCEFYVTQAAAVTDEVNYVYMAYTTDRLVLMNNSTDQWMPLGGVVFLNKMVDPAGIPMLIGDPALYGNPTVFGQIDRLAPNQCLLFTNGAPTDPHPPQPCDVVFRVDLGSSTIFWGAAFEIDAAGRDRNGVCPAATPDRLTICAMPR